MDYCDKIKDRCGRLSGIADKYAEKDKRIADLRRRIDELEKREVQVCTDEDFNRIAHAVLGAVEDGEATVDAIIAYVEKTNREFGELQDKVVKLQTQVNIAAGMLSTTEGYSDKHPEVALKAIQDAAQEVIDKDEENERLFGSQKPTPQEPRKDGDI